MYDYDSEEPLDYLSKRKALAPVGKHIPNKAEGQVLRRIMSQSGLTEAQVRGHKTYRRQLAKARAVPTAKRTPERKFVDRLVKGVTRRLKLAKEHPQVRAELSKLREDYFSGGIHVGWGYNRNHLDALVRAMLK